MGRVPAHRPRRGLGPPSPRRGPRGAHVRAARRRQDAGRAWARGRLRLRVAAHLVLLLQEHVVRGVHLLAGLPPRLPPQALAQGRRRLHYLLRRDGGVPQGDARPRGPAAGAVPQGARAHRRPGKRRRGGAEARRDDDRHHAPQLVSEVPGPAPRAGPDRAHGLGLLHLRVAEPGAGAAAVPAGPRAVGSGAGRAGRLRRQRRRPLPHPHQRPLPQRLPPRRDQPRPRPDIARLLRRTAAARQGGAAEGGRAAGPQARVPGRHVARVHGRAQEGLHHRRIRAQDGRHRSGRLRTRHRPCHLVALVVERCMESSKRTPIISSAHDNARDLSMQLLQQGTRAAASSSYARCRKTKTTTRSRMKRRKKKRKGHVVVSSSCRPAAPPPPI